MEISKVRQTLGMLSSMVEAGEQHTSTSRQALREAIDECTKIQATEFPSTLFLHVRERKHADPRVTDKEMILRFENDKCIAYVSRKIAEDECPFGAQLQHVTVKHWDEEV